MGLNDNVEYVNKRSSEFYWNKVRMMNAKTVNGFLKCSPTISAERDLEMMKWLSSIQLNETMSANMNHYSV